jgi:hypothetical protein
MNETPNETPVAAPTENVNQADTDFFKELIIPVIDKHGASNGSRILSAVGDVLARMDTWPPDIKVACIEELLRIMSLAKSKAEKSS